MAAQLRQLPKEVAQKTAAFLVTELGWKEAKAASGVRAVAQAAARKGTA